MEELQRCRRCGCEGQNMYNRPYHWVECTNENCGARTPLACDYYAENDPESTAVVKNYWNHGVFRDYEKT